MDEGPAVLLSHLLDALPQARVSGRTDVMVTGIRYDSRQVRPGDVFVAVPSVGGGPESGGYRFIPAVAQQGGTVIVTETPVELPGVTVVHVADARHALADLSVAYYDYPSTRLQLFAVTGTDGKTTTTYLLEGLLAAAGHRTGLIGTIENKIGERRERNPDRMTTPESLDVQRTLRSMVDAGVTHAAIEASSHALALDRLRGCRFAGCALTNISSDHIEFHGSQERYIAAKTRLFTDFGSGTPAVLNVDDEYGRRLASRLTSPVVSYAVLATADLRAVDLLPDIHGTSCSLAYGSETVRTRVPIPGQFNVLNALAASALALVAGLRLEEIGRHLGALRPPPGRLQPIESQSGIRVLVDYAHTVHAFRSVLRTLRSSTVPPARLAAVFGAAGNRDRAKRPQMALIARELTDFFYITNEDPFGEGADAIIAEIRAGVGGEQEGTHFRCEPDRREAIRRALTEARPGDTVVILGKGHEQSIALNGRHVPWSDVDTARQILETLA